MVCREFLGDMQPGLLRIKDPVVDRALQLRHAIGMHVWNHASFAALAGEALHDSPFYQEFVVPAGMMYCYGIRLPMPLGDAHLAIGYSHPDDDPYGVEDGETLIGMLLPPFRAGVHAVRHFYQARSLLPHAVDELQLPIALFDADGREVHRSPQLCALILESAAPEQLTGSIRTLVNEALALRRRPAAVGNPSTIGQRQISSRAETYRLRAVFMPSCGEEHEPAILVEVDNGVPHLPTIAELHARGLTVREAQVAELLATGASNLEIAQRLGISAHTARTHAEHIFGKLGVHTRKAFLLALAN
jgi:DNA-binding CsgD family transcriptional regulator